jgi:hypothetical protein
MGCQSETCDGSCQRELFHRSQESWPFRSGEPLAMPAEKSAESPFTDQTEGCSNLVEFIDRLRLYG